MILKSSMLARIGLLACLATVSATSSFAHLTVCREPRLSGHMASLERAERVLPTLTHNIDDAAIYIERDKSGNYYYQSNFLSLGATNPTKIGGSEKFLDVYRAFENIVWTSPPSAEQTQLTTKAFRNVRILLDRSVFDDNGRTELRLGNAEHIALVNTHTIEAAPSEQLNARDSPPPVFLEKVLGCCLFVLASYDKRVILSRLENIPLKQNDIRFVSMLRDSGTDRRLQKSVFADKLLAGKGGDIRTREAVVKLFSENRGKTVIWLGHTEGDSYVLREGSKKLLEMKIADVRSLARENGVQLVDIGCNTAHEMMLKDKVSGGIHVINSRFNSVKAIDALDNAVRSSTNFKDFYGAFAVPELKLVLTGDSVPSVANSSYTARLVTKLKRIIRPDVEVGAVTLTPSLPAAKPGPATTLYANGLQPKPATKEDDLMEAIRYFTKINKSKRGAP